MPHSASMIWIGSHVQLRLRMCSLVNYSIMYIFQLTWTINSLWPSGAIWQHRSGSTLAQVMACCLMAPSYYLNQCWLIINAFCCIHLRTLSHLLPPWNSIHSYYVCVSGLRDRVYSYLNLLWVVTPTKEWGGPRESLTLNVRGPSYLGLTRSISWLLMPWLLTSPGHQQP